MFFLRRASYFTPPSLDCSRETSLFLGKEELSVLLCGSRSPLLLISPLQEPYRPFPDSSRTASSPRIRFFFASPRSAPPSSLSFLVRIGSRSFRVRRLPTGAKSFLSLRPPRSTWVTVWLHTNLFFSSDAVRCCREQLLCVVDTDLFQNCPQWPPRYKAFPSASLGFLFRFRSGPTRPYSPHPMRLPQSKKSFLLPTCLCSF